MKLAAFRERTRNELTECVQIRAVQFFLLVFVVPFSAKACLVMPRIFTESRFKAELSKVKMKVKGGAAVDPDSELEDSAHVMKGRGDSEPMNAVLGMVDLVRGSNSYYKLQALEADRGNKW